MTDRPTIDRNVTHAIFTVERTLCAKPARVWKAFATEAGKDAWFGGTPGSWDQLEKVFDFREGGEERLKARRATRPHTDNRPRYYDNDQNEPNVYAYDMFIDGNKISVSLATLELKPAGEGTKLTLTEQGAFLDGYDDAGSREHGTNILMDRVVEVLSRQTAEA
jgi:uncharacterized protein YndB with AHSA1/START domain